MIRNAPVIRGVLFCKKIKISLDIKLALGCIVTVENKLGVRK